MPPEMPRVAYVAMKISIALLESKSVAAKLKDPSTDTASHTVIGIGGRLYTTVPAFEDLLVSYDTTQSRNADLVFGKAEAPIRSSPFGIRINPIVQTVEQQRSTSFAVPSADVASVVYPSASGTLTRVRGLPQTIAYRLIDANTDRDVY